MQDQPQVDSTWIPLLDHTFVEQRNPMSRPLLTGPGGEPLPPVCVMSFMGDVLETYAQGDTHAEVWCTIHSEVADFVLYKTQASGHDIGFIHAPVGAPAAAIVADLLIASGVQALIACGGCGVLHPIDAGAILIPTRALRDEGTSYHYLEPAPWVDLAPQAIACVEQTLNAMDVPFEECSVWTSDGFFRETPRQVQRRVKAGCTTVDMECAALAALAQSYDVPFAEVLYAGDILAHDEHDERDWLSNVTAREVAFFVALTAAAELALAL